MATSGRKRKSRQNLTSRGALSLQHPTRGGARRPQAGPPGIHGMIGCDPQPLNPAAGACVRIHATDPKFMRTRRPGFLRRIKYWPGRTDTSVLLGFQTK
jgi:hypothetical protein